IHTQYSLNYLVEKNGSVLLIDCSCKLEDLIKIAPKIYAIILTHGHFDHFAKIEEVQNHYGCPVYMHKSAYEKLSNDKLNASRYFNMPAVCNLPANSVKFIQEGQLAIKQIDCQVYFAPGHTNDSILIKIDDALFVGDFVFENTYGRADLPTGNFIQMQNSLKKHKNLILQSKVFSGH
ncbi:MAG: MBL fold metallo-hydrolase, partial [Clostridia bacterium]|nr:MBL fold metallo-hydrolase [Clostridia bacterium]